MHISTIMMTATRIRKVEDEAEIIIIKPVESIGEAEEDVLVRTDSCAVSMNCLSRGSVEDKYFNATEISPVSFERISDGSDRDIVFWSPSVGEIG